MKVKTTLLALLCLLFVGCAPVENQARDASAALKGIIETAQQKHLESCKADPSQDVCQKINKGVDAQNALVTATQAYCGWSADTPPENQKAPCVAVEGAKQALETAIKNANRMTTEVKGAL